MEKKQDYTRQKLVNSTNFLIKKVGLLFKIFAKNNTKKRLQNQQIVGAKIHTSQLVLHVYIYAYFFNL